MAERKKLELELNKQLDLTLLFDDPVIGNSRYGAYYLYAVRNGSDTEYSFFAPEDVHEQIKGLKKGEKFQIIKLAEQKGSKIVTRHEVKLLAQPTEPAAPIKESALPPAPRTAAVTNDNYYELMLASCRDAVKIQNELGGLMDAKSNGYG